MKRENLERVEESAAPKKELDRREWVYVQRPREYEIAGCRCGNNDPDWSEFKGHLWCAKCKKDFAPKHDGVFDGPIPVQCSELMGLCFDRINLKTKQIEVCWPRRIQRKRKKGWRMPYSTVYVGRPSLFGNPFSVDEWGTDGAIKAFKLYLEHHRAGKAMETFVKLNLGGKNLACWCPLDQPCHADVLLEIANEKC